MRRIKTAGAAALISGLLATVSVAGPFSNVGKDPPASGDKGGGGGSSPSPKEVCQKSGHDWGPWGQWSHWDYIEIVPGVECIEIRNKWRNCKRCLTTGHEDEERPTTCRPKTPSCK